MSRCVYEVYYIPWIDNDLNRPWIYSGSDYYNNQKYLGSAASKEITDWSDGMTVSKWWSYNTKMFPENFMKIILVELSDDITRIELQALESAIQKSEDHRQSYKYFNKTNKHFNSPHQASPLKGMTYEEIYGKDTAKKLCQKRSESAAETRKIKNWNPNKNGKLTGKYKGMTYEERHGIEKSIILKEERSKAMTTIAAERENSGNGINRRLLQDGKHASQIKVSCKYCGKTTDKANYTRWHGNKCKMKH
jgi:hypothetical protein